MFGLPTMPGNSTSASFGLTLTVEVPAWSKTKTLPANWNAVAECCGFASPCCNTGCDAAHSSDVETVSHSVAFEHERIADAGGLDPGREPAVGDFRPRLEVDVIKTSAQNRPVGSSVHVARED